MLPQIASGVGSILFAINIDNAALDTGLTDAENEVKTINLLKVTGLSQITVEGSQICTSEMFPEFVRNVKNLKFDFKPPEKNSSINL